MSKEIQAQNISSPDFCLSCGNIVTFPSISNVLECSSCKFSINLIDYPNRKQVTIKNYNEKKDWLDQYKRRKDRVEEKVGNGKSKKGAIVTQKCGECGNNEMYFYTLQLRSADEGSTVFYECVKCG